MTGDQVTNVKQWSYNERMRKERQDVRKDGKTDD